MVEEIDNPVVDILGIDSLLGQAEPFVHKAPIPKPAGRGRPFFNQKIVHGRGYWYILQNVKENGKWKLKMLAYCGARKPRGSPAVWLEKHKKKVHDVLQPIN